MSTDKRHTVSPPKLAERWGVSPSKVLHFIRAGDLKAFNISKYRHNRPRFLIDLADVEAFEKSRAVVPDLGESTTRRLRRRPASPVKNFFP